MSQMIQQIESIGPAKTSLQDGVEIEHSDVRDDITRRRNIIHMGILELAAAVVRERCAGLTRNVQKKVVKILLEGYKDSKLEPQDFPAVAPKIGAQISIN